MIRIARNGIEIKRLDNREALMDAVTIGSVRPADHFFEEGMENWQEVRSIPDAEARYQPAKRWTEQHGNVIRTFETRSTVTTRGGPLRFEAEFTRELATSTQIEELRAFGFRGDDLSEDEARLLLLRILRPIDYSLRQTFENIDALKGDSLRKLQVKLLNWEYCCHLPRYGPYSDWRTLNSSGVDHHRRLTKEERISITYIAYTVLPLAEFTSLVSNGVKKYKDSLDRSACSE